MNFGTNHLGHFLLTLLLLDNVKQNDARVITVASRAHIRKHACVLTLFLLGCDTIHFDGLKTELKFLNFQKTYAHSKLANILFAYELERRLRKDGDTKAISVVLHPGLVNSGFTRNLGTLLRFIVSPFFYLFGKNSWQGAQTNIYCALSPEVKGGCYYVDCAPVPSTKVTYDKDLAAKLWKVSEEFVADYLK